MQEMEWNASTVVLLVVVLALVAFAAYRAYASWTGKKRCCGGSDGPGRRGKRHGKACCGSDGKNGPENG